MKGAPSPLTLRSILLAGGLAMTLVPNVLPARAGLKARQLQPVGQPQLFGANPPARTPPSKAAGGGIAITSETVDLPADDKFFTGPGAETMNANCTGCHSASMVTNQPKLTADAWRAEISKMRSIYKAPVAESDQAEILNYLTALQSGGAG